MRQVTTRMPAAKTFRFVCWSNLAMPLALCFDELVNLRLHHLSSERGCPHPRESFFSVTVGKFSRPSFADFQRADVGIRAPMLTDSIPARPARARLPGGFIGDVTVESWAST